MLGGSVRIAVAVSLLRICSGDSPVEVATSLKTVDATLDHIHESVVLARGRHGLHATPKGDSWVGQLLRAVGEWEQPIIDIVYEGLAFKGDTIWECGGHIGAHTLGLIRIVGEGGHVHVWEPQHKTRSLLTTALTINGLLSRATVHPEALGGPDDAMQTPRLNLERVRVVFWTRGAALRGHVSADRAAENARRAPRGRRHQRRVPGADQVGRRRHGPADARGRGTDHRRLPAAPPLRADAT
ncbi:hypothetical protein M885DRAFT_294908 [Pelagophyceae sp. CCMP2097]|nr:hypothetical protein M885DRAFT_294908 [Pelagophyceae sp. CCMP2097]